MPVLFLSGLKQSGCEANHSLPSGASVRNMWHYTAAAHFHGLVLGWAWELYPISVVFEMGHHAVRFPLNGSMCNLCPSFLKISRARDVGFSDNVCFVLHRVKWQAVTRVERYWEMEM
jgi:hypothetical protein